MSKVLTIRADADSVMGTGHVMRCLALGQAWKDAGGEVVFITACRNTRLLQRLTQEGFAVQALNNPYPHPDDWWQTKQIVPEDTGSWLVLDGYHFDECYQRLVKERGCQLLLIDDLANLQHYCADIVLNQNLHALPSGYSFWGPQGCLLLGPRYVLLRREFQKWRGWKREVSETANKVLVTLGGADSANNTSLVLQALQSAGREGLEAVVAAGAGNRFEAELQSAVENSRVPVQLVIDSMVMDRLMAWADVAVSAAGATTWELAFMGLPGLLLKTAENQRLVAEKMHAAGAALDLGWPEEITPELLAGRIDGLLADYEQRGALTRRAQQLVDGEGTDRLLMRLEKRRLRVRPVRETDARLLWEWANDPEVRAVSFSTQPVLWEQHLDWLRKKLKESCHFYLAVDGEEEAIGQVRFDIREDEAAVSVSLGRRFRGAGYGTELLRLACGKLFRDSEVKVIKAYVKPDNQASLKAFDRAGFCYSAKELVQRQEAICLSRRRD